MEADNLNKGVAASRDGNINARTGGWGKHLKITSSSS